MQRSFLISAGGIFILSAFVLVRGQWAEAVYRLILEGLFAGAWLFAAAGIGAAVLRAMGVTIESKALAFTTSAALGLGTMSLLVLGLGLGGWMNRGVALGVIVVGLGLGLICLRKARLNEPVLLDWRLLLFAPTIALAVVSAFMLPGVLWSDEPAGYDVLAYHLQIPREWYELGRIVPLRHNVFSYFPFNVEMHYLLAMHLLGGAYAGMYLAQLMHVVFVGLSVLAVMGLRTARPQAGVVAAIAMGSFPWLMMLAPIAYNEGGLLLFGTLAIVWVMRSFVPSPGTPGEGAGEGSVLGPEEEPSPNALPAYREKGTHVALAGVMTGFACGSKLTAAPMLLVAIPVVAAVLRWMPVKSCVIFLVAGLLTFSPWLVRNQIWAGNPVFPEAAKVLGQAHFTDAQVARWSDAHRPALGAAPRVFAVWEQVAGNWRWGFVLLTLGLVAIALAWRRADAKFLAGLLFVQFLFWIGFTHVQGRFLILAAPIAAMLIAQVDVRGWPALPISVASAAMGWIILGRVFLSLPPSLGVDDFGPVVRASILPEAVASRAYEENRQVVLVGDAQAFMYSIPMSRLRYRTVFDVVEWIDPSTPAEAIIVVNPIELRRLYRSYTNLPPLPARIEGRMEPFILPR